MIEPMGEASPGRRIRVLYIVSRPVRWVSFEWLAARLDRRAFDPSFLLLGQGPPPLAPYPKALDVQFTHLPCRGRRDAPRVALAVARYRRAHGIDVVHARFMDAWLGGLTGARLAGGRVRAA